MAEENTETTEDAPQAEGSERAEKESINPHGEKIGFGLRQHLDSMRVAAEDAAKRAEAWAKVEAKKAEREAYLLGEDAKEEEKDLEDRLHEVTSDAPSGSHAEFVAERREEMAGAGATESEIQDAEHSGNLIAGDTDEDGDPAPAPGSDADEQTGDLDKDEKAEPEEDRDSTADDQRAALDLAAPDKDKREAAIEAKAQDEGRPSAEDLREKAGVGDDATRAEAAAAIAQDAVPSASDQADEDLTVEELKGILRDQGKKVSGNKDELLARLHGEAE